MEGADIAASDGAGTAMPRGRYRRESGHFGNVAGVERGNGAAEVQDQVGYEPEERALRGTAWVVLRPCRGGSCRVLSTSSVVGTWNGWVLVPMTR